MTLEQEFEPYRRGIVGVDALITGAGGRKLPLVYADWIASGRLYRPLEEYMLREVGPWVANTHTETTFTGTAMTRAYHNARDYIKAHVGASSNDSLFLTGFGMTAAINKLQRLLGLRFPECCPADCPRQGDKPLVFITHMEHHSNQITWEECWADVEIIPREAETGLPDLNQLESLLRVNRHRSRLIGSFTACSNVTGIMTPYHEMAALMHRYGGVCFVDFAASAPYHPINMHPPEPDQYLDAVMFSPHKFLGGPGASGVLVMNNDLYHRKIPDQPGGGTVLWTTPYGTHQYSHEIEVREDGGTPGFLQAIRTALALTLKASMDTGKIARREEELRQILLQELAQEPEIYLLEPFVQSPRLAVISFYARRAHHNLLVKLLNDRFGIQSRGGCSCAGTYGHILFNIEQSQSLRITDMINHGDLSRKPGWVRLSLHPTMTDQEVRFIGRSVVEVIRRHGEWGDEYEFHRDSGEAKGVDYDVMMAVFDKMGVDVTFVFYPWNRCIEMLKQKRADGILGIGINDERQGFLYYPEESVSVSANVLLYALGRGRDVSS